MTGNKRIAELIMTGGEAAQFVETMQDAEFFGMQTFDQSLLTLVKERRVSVSAALPHLRNSHDFRAKAIEAGVEA
jgi:Tfp pilus assembly ATPase PilU